MSKVDDELTRRFHRAERPMDGDDLFERLGVRRSQRERRRRIQAGLVAFAVLAATAGGFAILQEAFDSGERDVGVSPSPDLLPTNGEIVFVREGSDGRSHVFAAQPNGSGAGVRQITNGATDDSDPAVSPDGQTIAYVSASEDGGLVIATVPIEGGASTKLADGILVDDPAWSPDGTEVAFVKSGIDSILLLIVDRNGHVSRSPLEAATSLTSPSWAPDGTRIALAVVPEGSQGSVGIIPTNTKMMERPLEETLGVGAAPAWSPDGSRIAILRSGNEGDEIWTIAPDGTDETLVGTAVEASLEPDLAWAPDGTSLLVSDGDWIYRVDAMPEGDPRENFVRLVEGRSPSWQPLPADSDPPPSATPSISPEPEQAGKDIGIGFNLCSIDRLGGVDWFGDGTDGTAWTGRRVDDRGRCGDDYTDSVIAADLDGDEGADTWTGIDECIGCEPWAATDLDGNGTEELVVRLFADIQPIYAFYFAVPEGHPRDKGIYPIFLEGPGAPELRLQPEALVTVQAGSGEEGISANAIRCETYPDDPVLVVAEWILNERTGSIAYYGARLRLETSDDLLDAHFVVVDTFTPTATSEDFGRDGKACGVDFDPWT